MNNPKTRQQWIYDELVSNPNLSYSECWGIFGVKWGKTENTFTADWNKATVKHKEYQDVINNAKLEESIKIEKQAVRKAILTKHEALEILTEIAQGKPKRIEGTIVMPTPNERKGAIETMMKIEGWTATTKTEVELTTRTVIKWGDNEISI